MSDEAILMRNKCLKIGQESWLANDFDKATRMFEKSLRFGHSKEAEVYLQKVKNGEPHPRLNNPNSSESASRSQTNNPNSASRQTSQNSRTDSRSNDDNKENEPPQREYTAEQKNMADRINKCKTYYDILELNQSSANDSSIKKAYRKLALKMHPDKNGAPGANEAFKKLSAAYAGGWRFFLA